MIMTCLFAAGLIQATASPPMPQQRELPTPPAASPPPLHRAKTKANLASYIRHDDYPSDAMRRREQGKVGFRLHVGPDGKVLDCLIAEPSGSALLDQATCRIMRQRARYTPARDEAGNAVHDLDESYIRWILPGK